MRIAAWRAPSRPAATPRQQGCAWSETRHAYGATLAPTARPSLQSAPETPLRAKRLGGGPFAPLAGLCGANRHAPATQPGGSPIAEPAAYQDSRLDEGRNYTDAPSGRANRIGAVLIDTPIRYQRAYERLLSAIATNNMCASCQRHLPAGLVKSARQYQARIDARHCRDRAGGGVTLDWSTVRFVFNLWHSPTSRCRLT